MSDLASMVQVSLIGYAVSGAFLGLAYFDYYYTLIAVAIGLIRLAGQYKKEDEPQPVEVAPAIVRGAGPGSARALALRKKPLFGLDIRGWYMRL
jgi:hypothetical protein